MDFAPLILKMDFKDAISMRKALDALGISAEHAEKAIDKMSKAGGGFNKPLTELEKFQKRLRQYFYQFK
jgi:hypothetical protein